MKTPKDLGIKIGTPAEAKWTEMLKAQKEVLLISKVNQEIAETMIELAKKKIKEEEAKH